jgi:hypothetical protein
MSFVPLSASFSRNYVLLEAQDGDMVCALGQGGGFFPLRPCSQGRFTLVGNAFRSARAERELGAVLLASLNIDHDAFDCDTELENESEVKDHEFGSLYTLNVTTFDFDSV